MSKDLVIVESPTKAHHIQKFLGTDDYKVMASTGHIRDLQEKALSIDVQHGFTPEYVVPAAKRKVVEELKAAAKDAPIVWLASDEDREGEAISWHLVETLKLDPSKTRRITFHEVTKPAILDAIKHPRGIDENLVNAQQARRVLDRLVGFELSPVLWRRIQKGLSAGRVQSVALRLVVDREREIQAFTPTQFYRIDAQFLSNGAKVKGTLENTFPDIDSARKYLEDIANASYKVDSFEEAPGTRTPSAPFTTSTLQQEAARKLHLPVSVTMRLAQGLYERGLITYMRTDSTNLSALAVSEAKKYVISEFGEQYSRPRQYKTRSKGAQEAHEAIRPTFISNTDIEGTPQERKLYDLIWKRTVASQMSDAVLNNTTVKIATDKRKEKFIAKASTVVFDGFLKLYFEGSDDTVEEVLGAVLPKMEPGESLACSGVDALCKYTQPPFRYSEQTLVKELEKRGIGRPSTYAPIISTLTTGRGYLVKGDKPGETFEVTNLSLSKGRISESVKKETVGSEKGKLLPQDIGLVVTDYLVGNFPGIVDYDFTANVEKEFDSIASGDKVWNEQIASFYGPFHSRIITVINEKQYTHVEREIGVDPSDGKMITAKLGQYGPYVQKGEGASKQCANLNRGQLIESLTLEEALKLFQLPRTVGEYEGIPVVALKGRFGPYLKYGERNVSLGRGQDPLQITLDECIALIKAQGSEAQNAVLKEFGTTGIQVINGRFGPYIKFAGANYKIPRGTDPQSLDEKACRDIIANGPSTSSRKYHRTSYKK